MRGFAILLVVLGHSIGTISDPMNRFLLSFHMPLFFFVSGIVSKCKSNDGVIPFNQYLLKKVKGILIPQLTLFALNMVFDVFIEHELFSFGLLLTNFFNWFLVVLFYVTILFWAIVKVDFIKKKVFLLGSLAMLTILTQVFRIKTLIHVETIPMAMLFFVAGYYFREWSVDITILKGYERLKHHWIVAIPIIVICSYWNSPVTMYNNSYGNLLLFSITSMCGIWVSYEIGTLLKENTVLKWLGRNSIIIYVFHARILNVLHGLGKKIFPALANSNYLYPAYWHYFFLTMVILVPIIFICNRYLFFLFGKTVSARNHTMLS